MLTVDNGCLSSELPEALQSTPLSLADVDISEELPRRAVSARNRRGEIAGMYSLAVTVSDDTYNSLKRLSNLAIELCNAGSGGVSVIERTETGETFRWRALAGVLEHYEGGSTPRDWSPCGECLKAGRASLYSYPHRYFTYFQNLELPIIEGLVIPMFSGAVPVGTIWSVSHNPLNRFNAEHVRIMTSLGAFAVSALRIQPAVCTESPEQASIRNSHAKPRQNARPFGGELASQREIVWREYVRRAAQNDESALEALVEETRALVFATVLRVVSFPVDAEEVAADVYARVWMTAGGYDAYRGPVGAWLISMARSMAIDRLRARRIRHRSEAALMFKCGCTDDPEVLVDESRMRERLQCAIKTLPFEQRRAVELFYFSELPLADVTAKLGCPLATVKARLRLGLTKLRRQLAALESPRPKRKPIPRRIGKQSSVAVVAKSAGHERQSDLPRDQLDQLCLQTTAATLS